MFSGFEQYKAIQMPTTRRKVASLRVKLGVLGGNFRESNAFRIILGDLEDEEGRQRGRVDGLSKGGGFTFVIIKVNERIRKD